MIRYDSVTLVPRVLSSLSSRSEADTSVRIGNVSLEVPLVASPMPDVCNGEMAGTLARKGALGIIHRFQSIEEQIAEYGKAMSLATFSSSYVYKTVGSAIGVTGDYLERFKELMAQDCRIFCLDTANGFNTQVQKAIETIRKNELLDDPIFLIAGNVATKEGFQFLSDLGVDAVRVGIAGGSVCETKTETGVYVPTLHSVREIYDHIICPKSSTYVNNLGWVSDCRERKVKTLIIADGGVQKPADLCKALAVGADLVMAGSIFAGTAEAPGDPIMLEGVLYKTYRGAASFGIQKSANNKEPDYVEGRESLVTYKGHVADVIARFQAGLKSSMSYMNARNLDEYRKNVSIENL